MTAGRRYLMIQSLEFGGHVPRDGLHADEGGLHRHELRERAAELDLSPGSTRRWMPSRSFATRSHTSYGASNLKSAGSSGFAARTVTWPACTSRIVDSPRSVPGIISFVVTFAAPLSQSG